MDETESPSSRKLSLGFGILAEAGLAVFAIALSLIGFYDRRQPLAGIGWSEAQAGLGWGIVTCLPLLSYLAAFHFAPANWFCGLKRFCYEQLRPLFEGSSLLALALLSIAAGIGEELLFRWSLQGGLTSVLENIHGALFAKVLGLLVASLVFGFCHAITKIYFLLTFLGGLFLGWTMIYFQNWIVPAVAHALYDFVALVYIVRILKVPSSNPQVEKA